MTNAEARLDGVERDALAELLGVPRLVLLGRVGSTQDVAHALAAEGAGSGTLVVADEQLAGRGRQGSPWTSEPGAGIWMTYLSRPSDASALDVLSLRLGLAAAAVLDAFAESPVRLKWPNDLYVGTAKLAGILVEARWRDARAEWVAIGFGLNVRAPASIRGAAGLRAGTDRIEVLRALVPAIRRASEATGLLTESELAAFSQRDLARDRRCVTPVQGMVQGITAAGELLVASDTGVARVRAGSLVFAEAAC